MYYNARSLLPKLDHLFLSVDVYHPHIICVVESWLGNEISSNELHIPGYKLYRKDRNRQGGGILVYITDFMIVSLFPDPDPQLELLALSIRCNNFKLNLCLFYRPPSSGSQLFDTLISYFIFKFYLYCVNFSDISHPYYSILQSIMSLYSLSQHVSDPTHTHHSGATSTIDLVFTEDSLLHTCEPLSNSDHYGIRVAVNKKVYKHRCKTKGRKIWRYTYADWDGACEAIDETVYL